MTLTGRSKVAIVGFCETNRELAPYEDPSWEIWGLNRGSIFMHRADVWFDMHSPEIRHWDQRRPGKHELFLRSFGGPVYLHEVDPHIPNSIAYPLADVAADIGQHVFRLEQLGGPLLPTVDQPYLTSSITYELALAIHEGYAEIALYGVDLNTSGEYAWQKASVEYLLGLAAGRGIRVILPTNCPLLAGNLYGRGFMKPEGEKLTSQQFDERLATLQKQASLFEDQRNQLIGARRELMFLMEQLAPGLNHEKLDKRRQQMNAELANVEAQLAQCHGALKEALYWAHQTPDGQDPKQAIAQLAGRGNGHAPVIDADGESSGLVLVPDDEGPMLAALAGVN